MKLGHRKHFMTLSLKARQIQMKLNEWGNIKLESFYTTKESDNQKNKGGGTNQNGRCYLQTNIQRTNITQHQTNIQSN